MPPSRLLLFALVLIPLSSCCSLARFFCGLDTTPWVSVRFETPRLAVMTLLEALRRDDPEIVCVSFSQAYQARLQINVANVRYAWARIREANPGLHVAGYAEVPEPTRLGPDRASVTVDVEDRQIRIDLVRECWWEVRYMRPPGSPPGEQTALVPSFDGRARVEAIPDPVHDRSRLILEPLPFDHEGLPGVALDDIEHAALTRRWKVDYVLLLTPQ